MAKVKVPDGTVAKVFVVVKDGGYEFEIDTEISDEVLAAVLHAAADQIEGKVDRAAAAGAWGR